MLREDGIVNRVLEELDVLEKQVETHQFETLNLCRHLLENDPTEEEKAAVRVMIDRIVAFKERAKESKISIWRRSIL